MKLKELRKYIAEYARHANEILQETRAENPEFLKQRWEAVLHDHPQYNTKATKNRPSRFRQSTSRFNTQQLKDYFGILKEFTDDIEQQKEEKEEYTEAGYTGLYEIINLVESEYYNYYYWLDVEKQEMIDETLTVIEKMANAGLTTSEIDDIITTAFYANGSTEKDKPHYYDTNYINDITQGGTYV